MLIPSRPAGAESPVVSFRGFLRSNLSILQGLENGDWAGNGNSLLTLNLKSGHTKYAKVEAELDITQYLGLSADQTAARLDSSLAVLFESVTPVIVGFRKMYLSLYTRYADISIGRQIINFGKGFIFSPIDVFSMVDITDISFRRSGSNAARIRIPLGDLSGMDLISSLGNGNSGNPMAVKTYTNIAGWDLDLTGIYKPAFYETYIGLSFKGDLILGVYGELVQHFVKDIENHDFKGLLGLDYSIGGDWLFSAEYYYREAAGAGLDMEDLLYGKHNLFGNIRYQVNDLMNASINSIVNLEDGYSFTTLQYYYSLFQNTDAILFIRHYELGGTWGILMPYDLEYGAQVKVKF